MRYLGIFFGAWMILTAAAAADQYLDPNPPSIQSNRGAWPIRRQWTPAETQHFAKWIEHLYKMKTTGTIEQRIAKTDRMIQDPEMNLLEDPAFRGAGSNPQMPAGLLRSMNNLIDCGKFTAFMPAYYAYRRALPWMSNYVRSSGGDVRTATYTIPSGNVNSFTSPSLASFFQNAVGGFISGNYRVPLEGPNSDQSDTVPVAIDPKYLLPGCMNYVDGHCLILAKVDDYGELHFINASMTVTRDIYTYNGLNTVAGITPAGLGGENQWDGCFQGLRVLRYPIAETDGSGRVTKVRRRTNEEMKEFGFSTEQYTRVRELYDTQNIEVDGLKPQSFHDYIRLRMMRVDEIRPLEFMEDYADQLVDMFKFREQFVQDAWDDTLRNGPVVYPEEMPNSNIFQAHGRWETWSSPSSDVDRRNKYFYLSEWMDYAIRWYAIAPDFVDLKGLEKYNIRSQADLAKALIEEKKRIFASHSMEYKNSQGRMVPLTLADIEARMYKLSFDPNHPPELRWGAEFGSDEMAQAPNRPTPVPSGARVPMEEAYRLQAYYRHVGLRETEMSLLRGMFTEGFPVRDKFDTALMKWFGFYKPTETMQLAQQQAESSGPVPALVPAHFTAVQVENALTRTQTEAAPRAAHRAVSQPRVQRSSRRGPTGHTPLLRNPPRVR